MISKEFSSFSGTQSEMDFTRQPVFYPADDEPSNRCTGEMVVTLTVPWPCQQLPKHPLFSVPIPGKRALGM